MLRLSCSAANISAAIRNGAGAATLLNELPSAAIRGTAPSVTCVT